MNLDIGRRRRLVQAPTSPLRADKRVGMYVSGSAAPTSKSPRLEGVKCDAVIDGEMIVINLLSTKDATLIETATVDNPGKRDGLAVALVSSQLVGIAETGRARFA